MNTGRKDDVLRATVMAALLEGQAVNQIARDLKIGKATVSRLKNELLPEHLEQIGTEKRDRITAIIEAHLVTALTCANQIAAKTATNQTWFNKQSAGEIAVLFGVYSDKAFRILEAIQPAEADPIDEAQEDADLP